MTHYNRRCSQVNVGRPPWEAEFDPGFQAEPPDIAPELLKHADLCGTCHHLENRIITLLVLKMET